MITPVEIFKKALRRYPSYLQSKIAGTEFFPLVIPGNKIPSKSTSNYSEEIKRLYLDSKEKRGFGYEITYTEKRKKGLGLQSLPTLFSFLNEIDFLKYLGKEKEVEIFIQLSQSTFKIFPDLRDLVLNKPSILQKNIYKWEDYLKVLTYFKNNPRPNLYNRELPINVHTKFIENNKGLLQELLNIVLEPEYLDEEAKNFEKRFGLKKAEPMIRFKVLDEQISKNHFAGFDDLALPLSAFKKLTIPLKRVLVVENKVSLYNALTIPNKESTIVIFGKGYSVVNLKAVEWLKDVELIYWGDFDAHGFDILSQLRGFHDNVKSILMDRGTFEKFYQGDKGKTTFAEVLPNLMDREQELYQYLRTKNLRLEQEKIPRDYFIEAFGRL
ncbi:Wadjet anti-phage system protein JetD domain-containing protein [Nonlabens agnitus]|uniref:Wadjet protein JetD C-terminal domain-containing protein n=1 Tax=Nonlabens agnitus TaxID=870484 RepID=A0A2S9WQX3_9FLAO|nr:Wadjet anti-phage system protein JetD domain-containing protein [Nonlabens agnitus]PRP65861.1 hypothetical protein BST86_01535 [Nonlabens agnitus]